VLCGKSIKAAKISSFSAVFSALRGKCLMVMLSTRESWRVGKFNPFIAFDFLVFSAKVKITAFEVVRKVYEKSHRGNR
jgi:hypothetical protein